MTATLIFGAAAGVILGLGRFKVLALLPVILLLAAGAVANSVARGLDLPAIALHLLLSVALPQIGYLVASVGASYILAKYLRVRAKSNRPALLRVMQTEIGRELRTAFDLPRELPPEIAALLAQMIDREGSLRGRDHSGRPCATNC